MQMGSMGYNSKDEALEEDHMPLCVYDCSYVLNKCVCMCVHTSLLLLANTSLTK